MIDKQVQFFGKTASGIFCHPLFGSAGTFEKIAGAPAFADWDNGDQFRRYISTITKEDRKRYSYVLVNALGAGEYFGSNINADYFPWEALSHEGDDYGYKTFLKAHAFQHHVNKDPTRAFGHPVLSLLNIRMKRVELVVRLDREKAKIEGADGVIARIDRGEFPDVSMGCKVPYDVCYKCKHKSKTRDDYCIHMHPPEELRHIYGPNKILPDGIKCCVINLHPRFFDISFVFIGADKTAKVMAKLASRGNSLCFGDVCAVPRLSAEVFSLVSGSDSAPLYKEASTCECGCSGGCSDFGKFAEVFTVRSKKASQSKIGEIIKNVPVGTNSLKVISQLESSEPTISKDVLDDMAQKHDLGTCCSTTGMMGIVLKPREFQRIVLIRMGENDLADKLDKSNTIFRSSDKLDESIKIDKNYFDSELMSMLLHLLDSRSGFGVPFKNRMIHSTTSDKKILPTETSMDHSLLNKIGEAYSGYRKSLLQKISQAEEVIQNDPQLRETIIGNPFMNAILKTSSVEDSLVTPNSISYFSGVHLPNRDLLSNEVSQSNLA